MSSFTTIYRAIVMLAVGAVVFKGWQLYGPTAEQVKSTVVKAVDIAETAWQSRQPEDENQSAADSQGGAPVFAATAPPMPANPMSPPATLSPLNSHSGPADVVPVAPILVSQAPNSPLTDKSSQSPDRNDDRVQSLLSRLEQLGVSDPKVSPWGSSGQLFRCCGRAALNASPTLAQHFEAVAADPATAAEQVVAKVEAWRMAQSKVAALR